MTENSDIDSIEKKTAAVDAWIGKIRTEGVVDAIDRQLLQDVLESCGANFEISESARESLRKYKNIDRRVGMDAVWGRSRVRQYRIWLRDWMADYEQWVGKPLPVLKGTEIKTSGGLKFFTDLTAFAAGTMSFEDYKRITEDRIRKGKDWKEMEGDPPVPSAHSSFPPEFPKIAWYKIKSWGKTSK